MDNEKEKELQSIEEDAPSTDEGTETQRLTGLPDIGDVLGKIDIALGNVPVVSGTNEASLPLVGQTVGYAREGVKEMWGIPEGAVALVNDQKVSESYVLKQGDSLDFVKDLGTKGSAYAVMTYDRN